jgi:hypothetical protein
MLREDNIQNQVQSVVYSNSLVVHDCLQVSLWRASEKQSFRLFFFLPIAILFLFTTTEGSKTLPQWALSVRVSKFYL